MSESQKALRYEPVRRSGDVARRNPAVRFFRGLNLLSLAVAEPRPDKVHPPKGGNHRTRWLRRKVKPEKGGQKYQDRLKDVHETIGRLAAVVEPLVGTPDDPTSELKVLRPLRQDALWSEKLRRFRPGHRGVTRSEFLTGHHQHGAEARLFGRMRGKDYENVRALVVPYVFGGQQSIDRRPPVRSNHRPEDLVIALDGSGRTWQGAFAPHGVVPKGSEKLPVVGVVEDERSIPTLDSALENFRPNTHGNQYTFNTLRVDERLEELIDKYSPPPFDGSGGSPDLPSPPDGPTGPPAPPPGAPITPPPSAGPVAPPTIPHS